VTLTLVISHHAYSKYYFHKGQSFHYQDNPEIIEQYSEPEHNIHAQITKDEKEIPK
jgi:hypothetical protein